MATWIKFAAPHGTEKHSQVECDACDVVFELWEVEPIKQPDRTVVIGDEVPAGMCPECGVGFCYLKQSEEN